MKKVYVYLCGGLGNQLFEYAAAKNLALKNNAKLIIDSKSGFVTDFRDATKFSLQKEKLKNVKYKKFNLVFLFYRLFKKIININNFIIKIINYKLIDESKINYFDQRINNIDFKNKIFLMGYFQSHQYFEENSDKILEEIWPKKPNNINYLKLSEKISRDNSVSIGVRLHENINKEFGIKINDSRKKKMIKGIGGITPIKFYVDSINEIVKKIDNPEFFIFSTKNSNIEQLISESDILKKFPKTIITADKGFEDAYDNLWLMSNCKNFIISNSTLYWWGAYFSKKKYKKNYVLCSSNFPNKDTCLKEWKVI